MRAIMATALLSALLWPVLQEAAFQHWWATDPAVCSWRVALWDRYGETPSPDAPEYDYRAAWLAGASPEPVDGDTVPHWPSRFKSDTHPNRYVLVGGQHYDTKREQFSN
jgi:hypothetical protein